MRARSSASILTGIAFESYIAFFTEALSVGFLKKKFKKNVVSCIVSIYAIAI